MDNRTAFAVMMVTIPLCAVVVLRVRSQRLAPSSPNRLAISRHEGMLAWSLRLRAARPRHLTLPRPRGMRAWWLRLRSCSPSDRLTAAQHEGLIALLDAFDKDNEITLEFWQIENAIGGLPKHAKHSVSWWTGEGNAKPAWHPPGVWQDAGYIAYPPNLRRRFVTFRRGNHPRQRQETLPCAPTAAEQGEGTMMCTDQPVMQPHSRPIPVALRPWYTKRPFSDGKRGRPPGNGLVAIPYTDAMAS